LENSLLQWCIISIEKEDDDRERKQAIQMIKRIGDLWILFDSDGRRVLGKHKTKKEAEKQESAINIAKAIKTRHRKKKK
jgi:hypothetical protein